MIDSEIFKYFRTLNDFIPSGELLVDTFGNTDVFISVTTNTFYIFDLNKFNILFTGPYIPGITQYVFHKDILFISTGKSLGMYQRSSKIGNFDYKEEINQVMCIGEIIITLHKNRIEYRKIKINGNNDDCNKDDSEIIDTDINDTPIVYLHHPMAYLNKILLISDSQTSLYNFIKKKEIYKFKSFKKGVCVVRNTKVVDLVGVGYTNGQIDFINLKKDEILFSFKDLKVKDLDFSNEKMCVVGGGDLYLFDLIEKRLILKTRAVTGKFIGEDYILISREGNRDRDNMDEDYKEVDGDKDNKAKDDIQNTNDTTSTISLFKIHNNSLNLIKVKNNLKSEVLFLEEGSLDNTFVVVSKGEVFKYNTGNTLSYQKLKFKGKIEKMSFKGGEGVLYGDKILYKLGTSIKYVLNSEIDLITNYKEISGILVDGIIIILNLNTKMIYKKIPVNEPIKCIKMDRNNLYLLYEKRIRVVPYYKGGDNKDGGSSIKGKGSIDSNGSIDIDITSITPSITPSFLKVFDSLMVLSSNSGLFLFSNGILFRTFPGIFKDFTVSSNLKWLGVCKEDSILIFDILSGTQIDSIPCKGKFIRFTLDMMFILIVTDDNKMILLNNKSKFSPLKRREEKTISKIKKEDFLKIKKRHQKLTGEILLTKTLKEIEEREDENKGDIDLVNFTIFLNKILKNKKIKKEEAEKIGEKYEEIFKKFEENFIKSVGYLEIEKEGM